MTTSVGGHGVHPSLPAGALVVGAAALLVAAVVLVARPSVLTGYVGSPRMLALTHAFTLGFVTLVFAGTLQQLPAVMFVTRTAWPRLGYVSLPCLALGVAAMIFGFGAVVRPAWLAAGGALVCLSLGASLWQLLLTASRRPPGDPAGRALITSVVYLFLTVVLGTALAAVRARPALAALLGYPAALHQYVGLSGAFLLGIGGAGHKLLSMFALSKSGPVWRLRVMAYLVHLCLIAVAVGPWTSAGAALDRLALAALAGASSLQLWEVGALLRRRLRRRLEAPVRRYVVAHAFLPVAGLLLALGHDEAATAAFLLGFVGLAVSGMLVKILSFLTWTAAYSAPGAQSRFGSPTTPSRDGARLPQRPPLLRDLLRPELEPVTTWGLAGGTALVAVTSMTAVAPAAVAAAVLLVLGSGAQLAQVLHIVVMVNRRVPA